jgi:hypothetical protein
MSSTHNESMDLGPPDSHEAMNNREFDSRDKRSYEFLMGLVKDSKYETTKTDVSTNDLHIQVRKFMTIKNFFCSTLSEFENFLLCEPIVKTKRQANFKDFKRFGAFKGLVEQKKTLYSTRSYVNWAFLALVGL